MEDVSRWARALYEGPLLAGKQRSELMTVVSDKTGEPIRLEGRRRRCPFQRRDE
jgi:hypothetical protein